MIPFGLKESEGIDESCLHQFIKPSTFNWEKSGNVLVLFWSRKINRMMCCIHISTDDYSFTGSAAFLNMIQECVIEPELEYKPFF